MSVRIVSFNLWLSSHHQEKNGSDKLNIDKRLPKRKENKINIKGNSIFGMYIFSTLQIIVVYRIPFVLEHKPLQVVASSREAKFI